MKHVDIRNQVMDKIVAFEEKQSRRKLYSFWMIVIILGFIFVYFAYKLYQIIQNQQLTDLFELFREDIEVISLYWNDVMNTLLLEIPKEVLIGVIISIIAILFIVLFTKKRRKFLAEKLERVYNYKSKHPKRGNI
jgi:hypothetical protein